MEVQADDDNEALRIGHRYASQILQPFSLIEDEGPEILLAVSRPPELLPHALLTNMDERPEVTRFGYYVPNIIGRIRGDLTTDTVVAYNETVVRHIGREFPGNLVTVGVTVGNANLCCMRLVFREPKTAQPASGVR